MVARLCFPSFALGEVSTEAFGEVEAAGDPVEHASPGAPQKARFKRLQWNRRVSLIRCTAGPNHGHTISLKQITVAIHDGAAFEMEWRAPGSDRLRSDIVSHGLVSMGDADVPFWTRWRTPLSIIRFGIDKSFMTQVWRSEFDGANGHSIETLIGMEDPVIERIAALGRGELARKGAGGRLYVELLATALAIHLLRNYGAATPHGTRHKGGLPPAQLRRVVDDIDAHLSDDLGLIELATVTGLSPHHFGEAFKAATGTLPHRYVIAQRVDRARELLRDRERTISEVAYDVGFSSQSHLTFNFRRLTGLTPGRFRRSLECVCPTGTPQCPIMRS